MAAMWAALRADAMVVRWAVCWVDLKEKNLAAQKADSTAVNLAALMVVG